jgi:HrpA-like RNA helicase
MSATLDVQKLLQYFNNAAYLVLKTTLSSPALFFFPRINLLQEATGTLYPVEVMYSKEPERDYVEAAIRCAVQIHISEGPGDILIFLTGEQEIEEACKKITEQTRSLQGYHSLSFFVLVLFINIQKKDTRDGMPSALLFASCTQAATNIRISAKDSKEMRCIYQHIRKFSYYRWYCVCHRHRFF